MKKKRIFYKMMIPAILLFALIFCCSRSSEEVEPILRPVKTTVVGSTEEMVKTTFPGITQEVQSVELAFRVGGPLIKLDATEGQSVKKGQLIAEIDSRDFEVDLIAKEARYIQAKAEKERFEKTYERGSISKNEYDSKMASFLEAKSAYEAAKNALADTKLRAPFDGFIDQKMVENFERVHIGQTIVTLLDLSTIEVNFTIPEALAIQFRNFEDFTVMFDVYQNIPFLADLKEVGKKSEQSAGIPVTLTLRHKNIKDSEYKIIPGLSCNVQINLQENAGPEVAFDQFMIPASSIYADPKSEQKFVFVVDPDSMRVHRKPVQLGSLASSNLIWVLDGLQQGEILVTAGAKVLQDGQKVKFLD